MRSKSELIGRMPALDWLQKEALSDVNPNFSPVILVYGIGGVGKTVLCERFLHLLRHQQITGGDSIIVAYKGVPQSPSVEVFSKLLLEVIKRSLPDSARLNQPVRAASSEDSNSLRLSERYNEEGAVYSDAVSLELSSLCQEQKLANKLADECAQLIQEDYFLLGPNACPRIFFFFDQFKRYPESLKRWIGSTLYQAFEGLKQAAVLADCLYLHTSQQAWSCDGQADCWQVHPAALLQLELLRLTYDDCKQWLSEVGLTDSDLIDGLYEETEGVPARIEQCLSQKDCIDSLITPQASRCGEPLSQFSAKQRRWLHAAAMQVNFSSEALQLLLGKAEALQAMNWLCYESDLCGQIQKSEQEHRDAAFTLNRELRAQVLQQAKHRKPLCHAGYVEKINLLSELNKQVPSRRHRDLLSQLSPIQPLSDEVLNEVFGR